MKCFENHLLDMIKTLKFRNVQVDLQTKMKHDISKIRSSANVFLFANKTTNMYEIPPNSGVKTETFSWIYFDFSE